ncbi:MAG: RagB/SusD family nutrient uptake outer membrane protein, partial [Rikenellaceae bacterium]
MKLNIFKWMTLALFGFGLSSCEDFLTQENPYASSTEEFWSNISECNQSVTAIYATLRNEAILQTHLESFRADLAWPAAGRPVPENSGDEYMCYIHSYNNTSEFIQEKWEACYEGINRANQAIRGLNSIKQSLSDDSELESWVELMAQARFFRGLFHFYLHSAFNNGEIIIIDEIPIEIEDFYLPVSPSDDVISFFREDLRYAYENLPIAYENTTDLGRVTSGAAATILGTSYLYEFSEKGDSEKLDAAMSLFSYVIDDCGYELVQSHLELFTEENEMNSESIFEIVYSASIQSEMSIT